MNDISISDEVARCGESGNPEIVRMLMLSTAHLSSGEIAGLAADAVTGLVVYTQRLHDCGVFLYVPEEEPDLWGLPSQGDGGPSAELIDILRFAHERGIAWIKFDRDVRPVGELPVFDDWH